MSRHYVPDRADLVWLQFNPQAGHEQRGIRPALVVSSSEYNLKTGLALFCPITNQTKGYPFEVSLPSGLKVSGVVLADHVKNLDWKARNAKKIGTVPDDIVKRVAERIAELIEIN
jgi:mRNA interferase MazF